jgi:tetratricopeptide (TPR) repeat protein
MKNTITVILFLLFSTFSLAQATQTAPQTNTPSQTDPCPGCTPQQRQASELLKQGRKLHGEGKLDDALDVYKKAMAIAPEYWDVHIAIGSALDLKSDYAEARKHLQKAIDLADKDHKASALRSMAMSYAFEGNAKEVEKLEREAAQLQLTDKKYTDAAGTLNELARIELESGNLDKAYDAYKEGFGIADKVVTKPEDQDLWKFRWEHAQARIDARRGLKDEAQKHVAAAKAIFDKGTLSGQANFVPYLTGYVAFYGGDYKTARAELQKADQKDPFILALIAQTYEKLNDKVQAKEYWTKVLGFYSHNPTNAFARPLAKKALGM